MKRPGVLLPGRLLQSHLLGASGTGANRRSGQPRANYLLGDPGWPATVPTLLITVFDNSGSVTGPIGTDPLSNRFAEVDRAFSVVARRGSPRELGAVLHFDTPTSGDVKPIPLTKHALRILRTGLHVPPDGAGSSELAPSLQRARELADAHAKHEVTLVVLSDFYLMDPQPGPVLSDLAMFPGQVHAVVLGAHLPAGVLDDQITVTHVQRDDPPGAVARAVFASLVAHRPGSHVRGAVELGS